MTAAGTIVAGWLGPAIWLALPALLLVQGAAGLWPGLLVTTAPLLALSLRDRARADREEARPPVPLVHVATYFVAVAVLIWAGLVLAGDVGARLGLPRWQGIALGAAGGLLLTAWRGAERVVPALLIVAGLGVAVPLLAVSAATGLTPPAAWRAVADRSALVFPATSRWVTEGRDLRLAQGREPLSFEEAHRLTAVTDTTLRLRVRDGTHTANRDVTLVAGQSVVLRPGDRLEPTPGVRLKFEGGRRVPGAPPSGVAWAVGAPPDAVRALAGLGLAVTVLGGGIALFGPPLTERPARFHLALVAGVLVAAFWALQAWAVYTALAAPEVFMGGITPERLLDVPALVLGNPATARRLQGLLVVAVGAGFLASTVALRARLSAVDATGGGEIGHDLGLWSMVFVAAALASLWPIDPWALALTALGAASAVLLPAALLSARAARAGVASAAGVTALVAYTLVLALGRLGGVARPAESVLGALCEHPAVLAAPVGLLVMWLAARRPPRPR
jgi:hypothetical protein